MSELKRDLGSTYLPGNFGGTSETLPSVSKLDFRVALFETDEATFSKYPTQAPNIVNHDISRVSQISRAS